MGKLIHEKLTYDVRGVLMAVHHDLKPMLPEHFYQGTVEIGFQETRIPFKAQYNFKVFYRGEQVGLYIPDFCIDGLKTILELKVAPVITPLHKAQALSYLKVTDADLALIANFGAPSLEVERLPNFLRERQPEFVWKPQELAPDLLYSELSATLYEALHRVHFTLGPGFLHQVYRRATMVELRRQGIPYRYHKHLPVEFHGHHLGQDDCRIIVVEDRIAVAAFALKSTTEAYPQRLKRHLRTLGLQLGLLANFHGTCLHIQPVRTAT
jgi:GxxExxY protein